MTVHTRARAMAAALDEIGEGEFPQGSSNNPTAVAGSPSPAIPDLLARRVHVDGASGCWTWLGSRDRDGYGRLPYEGRSWSAHRLAYLLLVGPLVDGLVVHHHCYNRACCNPDHLAQVTSRENILDGSGAPAINARKTHCPQGHEFTPENTRWRPSGGRACRRCHSKQAAASRARRRAALDEARLPL